MCVVTIKCGVTIDYFCLTGIQNRYIPICIVLPKDNFKSLGMRKCAKGEMNSPNTSSEAEKRMILFFDIMSKFM